MYVMTGDDVSVMMGNGMLVGRGFISRRHAAHTWNAVYVMTGDAVSVMTGNGMLVGRGFISRRYAGEFFY